MRVKAIVMYDGSSYKGWQVQNEGNTIQETIEKVIQRISSEEIRIIGSGRTDAGVHALGQVFHFDTGKELGDKEWENAMNALLPLNIRIQKIEFVSDEFHARFSVKRKIYQYDLNCGAFDPFHYLTVYQYGKKLNIKKMKEATRIFIGYHDFTSFCANKKEEVENQCKEIYNINIEEKKDILSIEFVGEGFLRYMIRMIVGTLIKVGEEKLTVLEVQEMLKAKNKEICPFNAPACGLYLVKVEY